MYDPASLPPNAEEQDFIQAYENVREKYKGKLEFLSPVLCSCTADHSVAQALNRQEGLRSTEGVLTRSLIAHLCLVLTPMLSSTPVISSQRKRGTTLTGRQCKGRVNHGKFWR
ncbi:hypothetical protein SKAU_G00215510 [Synaphobranchus kaupii]|uniref:Uncharacterized protein n=1 Tax=Synaphobranchus kaupii TaxID=118154 RepID=A0A9Q1F9Q9_SYNKA|nr:hypothetical protein SKAU_G00215510 [Synaphobranchus kaupii]